MANLFKSKRGKILLNGAYSVGAAVVIIGALFKIRHLPGADLMLTIGLVTEAVIFVISAFEPPHEDTDWALVYPELAGGQSKDKKDSRSITQQLDSMLEKAKVGPELIENLGKGFSSLNDNVSKMGKLSDATVATEEYSKNVKLAATSVGEFNKAATTATGSINQMSNVGDVSKQYHEQVQILTKNLSSLNTIYELELQDSNNHLKAMNKFNMNLTEALGALSEATDDSKKFRDEIGKLSNNLASLNNVYGNMLTAMSGVRA